jgi:hypothetical protein
MSMKKGRFVLCINNDSYEASLEPRKVYRVVDDAKAEAKALLRIIDESGEDYLYPADIFVPVEIPEKAAPAFASQ